LAVVDSIPLSVNQQTQYITKDDLAIWDLVASNINDRPIYFSVTCKNEKLQGLNDYMQLEGLGLRIIPAYSKSDRQFSIYGSGRVAKDKCLDIFTNKWKWGNFDKHESFVDGSYLAATQSMKLVMLRTAFAYLASGEKQNCVKVVDKYFEAFPNFNFRYDAGIMPFLNVAANADGEETVIKHAKILLENTKNEADFYETLDAEELLSFSQDVNFAKQSSKDLQALTEKMKDEAAKKEIKDAAVALDTRLSKIVIADPNQQ
jgi:hypothetical protein